MQAESKNITTNPLLVVEKIYYKVGFSISLLVNLHCHRTLLVKETSFETKKTCLFGKPFFV